MLTPTTINSVMVSVTMTQYTGTPAVLIDSVGEVMTPDQTLIIDGTTLVYVDQTRLVSIDS